MTTAETARCVRKQNEARRVIEAHYPFKCCAVCGIQIETCLTIAHLDHNAGNNAADNLARLCHTHHWMYDAGLYPIEAIQVLQEHWQLTCGKPNHKPRMKDAGAKAAATRSRSAAARKAAETRKHNAMIRAAHDEYGRASSSLKEGSRS